MSKNWAGIAAGIFQLISTGTGCDYESWIVLITGPKSVASYHLQGEAPRFPQQPLQQPFRLESSDLLDQGNVAGSDVDLW